MDGLRWLSVPVVLALTMTVATGMGVPVSQAEARDWLLHVIPLPQKVAIYSKVAVNADEVVIVQARKNPSQLEKGAAQELVALFENQVQVKPPLAPVVRSNAWNIVVGVADEQGTVAGLRVRELERISDVPNAEQAYVIAPVGDNVLVLAGNDPRGAYYAAKTLQHLLRPKFSGMGGNAAVEIPLARIVDWPDLAERGQWGKSPERDIEWMAERKMNLCESYTGVSFEVTSEGEGVTNLDTSLIERGAKCAVKVVPIIGHLDGLYRTNILDIFPQAEGVSGGYLKEQEPNIRVACFAKKETIQVLGDFIVSLARQLPPQCRDISVWLTESWVHCYCEQCMKEGTWVLEAKAIAQGYERAKKVRPDLRLRVLLSQGSYSTNDKVIAALPPEIDITYYGTTTYTSNREPMIYPLLEEYVKNGGWLGIYPQLTANFACVLPWSAPQFIKFRMQEFVDKGLQSVTGYTATDRRFYDFNVTAAAEWSWNAHGRDEREFALAYFTQKGVSDPEKRADWAVMLGPVGWDVYGAGIPYHAFYNEGSSREILYHLQEQDKWPELGKGAFVYLPDEEHIHSNLATCAAAMKLAQQVGDQAMILETQVIEGYMKMLQAVYELGQVIGPKKELTEQEKQAAAQLLRALHQATDQTVDGLHTWTEMTAPDATHPRIKNTRDKTKEFTEAITEYVRTFLGQPPRPVENPDTAIKVPPGEGPTIGIYHNSYNESSERLVEIFREQNLRAFMLPRLNSEALALCDMLIIPQCATARFFNDAAADVREFVEEGGGVMLTHDAVGYRSHNAMFPEIGTGVANPKLGTAIVTQVHPVTGAFTVGDTIDYGYSYDHIAIEPGDSGEVVMADQEGHATVVVGRFGQGKVVLNGMLPGQATLGNPSPASEPKAPEGAELKFLTTALSWLAAR